MYVQKPHMKENILKLQTCSFATKPWLDSNLLFLAGKIIELGKFCFSKPVTVANSV